MSIHSDSHVGVLIPTDLYGELFRRYPGSVSSILEQISWDFLDRTAEDFQDAQLKPTGVYWERLFMPEGTEIRTRYFGDFKTAKIEGERIVWEGTTFPSMSQLAKAMRGNTVNNAWQVLEVRLPSSIRWEPASSLRR